MLVISDLHFNIESDNSFIFEKIEALSSAVNAAIGRKEKHLIVVVNGDIANQGKQEEFDLAQEFFESFEAEMLNHNSEIVISYIFIPGNHDCDFTVYSDDERKQLAEYTKENKLLDHIQEYLKKLGNFKKFSEKFKINTKINSFDFFTKYSFTDGGHPIYIIAYNSVIAFDHNYKYDRQIIDSTSIKDNIGKLDDGITLTFSHYPMEWFERENNDFLDYLEKNSNLIFMAHEHKSRIEKIIRGDGIEFEKIGGLSFSEQGHTEISGFDIFQIDSETTANSLQEFSYDGAIYTKRFSKDNARIKNTFKAIKAFVTINDVKYNSFLNEGFVLRNYSDYKFGDYFTLPVIDLHIQSEDDKTFSNYCTLDFFNPYDNDKTTLFTFKNSFGKTTLLKYFFKKFYTEGYVPVYIEINKKNKTTERITKAIDDSIKHFYDDQYEKIIQNPGKIILLIDQISEMKEMIHNVIEMCMNKGYKKIIATFDEKQYVFNTVRRDTNIIEYFEVMKFGHAQKYELIEKWVDKHNDYFDEIQKEHRIHLIQDCMEKADMNTGFISTPELVLIFLDAYENDEAENMVLNASRGFFYNYLFNKYIIMISTCSKIEMPFIRKLLEALAYRNFKSPDVQWKDFCREFIHNNLVEDEEFYNSIREIRKCMIDLKLIEDDVIGKFELSNKQFQSFFVASYYTKNMERLNEEILSMCDDIYDEEVSSVILFIVHLTKNLKIINKISSIADKLFANIKEIEFNDDISVINVLIEGVGNPIDYGDIKKQNRNLNKRLDYLENELAKKTPRQRKKEKTLYEKSVLASFRIREVINEILLQMLDREETELLIISNLKMGLRSISEYLKLFDEYWHEVDMHLSELDEDDIYELNDFTFGAVISFLSLILYVSDNLVPIKYYKFLIEYIKNEYPNNTGVMLRSLLQLWSSRKSNSTDVFDLLINFRNKMRNEKNYVCVAIINAAIGREINYIGLSVNKKLKLLEKSEAHELSKLEKDPQKHLQQTAENRKTRLGFIKKSRKPIK